MKLSTMSALYYELPSAQQPFFLMPDSTAIADPAHSAHTNSIVRSHAPQPKGDPGPPDETAPEKSETTHTFYPLRPFIQDLQLWILFDGRFRTYRRARPYVFCCLCC